MKLGIVEFHEVGRTLLEVLHEETLGIVEFHDVGKNFLDVLHRAIVVVLYEVGILYVQVHSNLPHFRLLHEVVRKLTPGLLAVILCCRYWSDVPHFYSAFDIYLYIFIFIFVYLFNYRIF